VRFLADENCDFAVVRALRAAGHDVLAVSEFQQRSIDRQLMEMAYAEDRILFTEDKDFGWLAFVGHVDNPGVIPIRFPASARHALAASVIRLVSEFSAKLTGAFVVLRPGSVRISNLVGNGHD
jgi:predicted nuclease of predicted toxin-antitoxin system